MDEQRIIEIETKLAYQEHMLSELNQALADQQSQLSHLERLSDRLVERLQSMSGAGESGEASNDERPPHY
ncbi:MAG: SlyX family protein [Halioglobus sp.]|nr:SlyX family protein [Halioglobus sp.]